MTTEKMSFRRRDLSIGEKLAILEAYDLLPQMSQREAAIQLGLSQPLLCRLLRNRYDIECSSADVSQHRKRRRAGKDAEVEAALKNWYWEQLQLGDSGCLTGDMLKRKAEEIAHNMGKSGFVATNGWFQRWRRRENISTGKSHEERPLLVSLPSKSKQQTPHEQPMQLQQQHRADEKLNEKVIEETDPKTLEDIKTITSSNYVAEMKQEPANAEIDESQQNSTHQPHHPTEHDSPPSADIMLHALDVLRRGVLHFDSPNIQIHYTYEAYIKNLLKR